MVKMKFFLVLLSCLFLSLLAVEANNYVSVVETTNIIIDWLCIDNEIWTMIKRLVSNDVLEFTMKEMAFMFALPEYVLQTRMQSELIHGTDLPVGFVYELVEGRKSVNELGTERRSKIRQALKMLILNILCQREPNISFIQTCRIIGLFLSTKFPASYTKTATVAADNTCVLGAVDRSTKSYKQFGFEIYLVSNENHQRKEVNIVNQL
ncbi:uncharacterized protein LOC126835433 isoform X3 [Adelges cooleyi]|uniref:uncharacterized protein LOC126835433 isoform X3 n=1 Tax=Adelges cooleyi TaxID=133065 RepID=UPI0021806203|nr:uncharacterized protein LOC126835433 isoform X3 [Adelges cooleyi]